jgi:hypothetical protein
MRRLRRRFCRVPTSVGAELISPTGHKPELLQWSQAVIDGDVVAVTEAGLLNGRALSHWQAGFAYWGEGGARGRQA